MKRNRNVAKKLGGFDILQRVDEYLMRYNAPEVRHIVREAMYRICAECHGEEFVETPYTPYEPRMAPWGVQTCNHWEKSERGGYIFCLRPVGHDAEHWPTAGD